MLKNIAFILIYCSTTLIGFSQQNNIWMLGFTGAGLGYKTGIDFNSGVADTFSVYRYMDIKYTNASICDSNGQLLFYTNGIAINNRNHQALLNSINFNPGYFTSQSSGLGFYDMCIVFSNPGSSNKYFLFHENCDTINFGLFTYPVPVHLSYSEIDMTLDNGNGGIVPLKKNIHIIDDTLILGKLAGVRHANGRDWWLITHELNSNAFYKILISQDTVYPPVLQRNGPILPLSGYGESIFSPNGEKFINQSTDTTVELYSFDRCTGDMSHDLTITIVDSVLQVVGESFSPSSRFLYINNNIFIRQYDLSASNILGSSQIVATWIDTITNEKFRVNRLAPDNKIYINTVSGQRYLSYINSPDSLGINCDVRQAAFFVPCPNTFSFPNYVNFSLGPVPGSVCDSIYTEINQVHERNDFVSLFPNPTYDKVSIRLNSSYTAKLILRNYLGEIVLEKLVSDNEQLDLSSLTAGTFIGEFVIGQNVIRKKIVKVY